MKVLLPCSGGNGHASSGGESDEIDARSHAELATDVKTMRLDRLDTK